MRRMKSCYKLTKKVLINQHFSLFLHIVMKRICFLTDSIFTFGGVQRVTAVIAKELAKTHDVTIVTFDDIQSKDLSMYGLGEAAIHYRFFSYPEACAAETVLCKAYSLLYRKVLPQNRLTSYIYGLSSFTSRLRDALCKELLSGEYDVIIGVHAPLAVRLATVKSRLGSAKTIGWIHNSHEAMFSPDSPYAGPELLRHFEYQYTRLDRTVLLCRCDREKYCDEVRKHAIVIPNPLTLTPGRRSERKGKRFLAIGRFSHRHKGFDILIEAFHIFAAQNSEWCLDIVGEGPEEGMYRKMIARYGLEERVVLHPFTKDVQKFYSEASVYVLSSRWEGFGLVIIEAMAHGLPVISSDLPSSRELMGETAIYFPNGDAKALAKCLTAATEDSLNTMSDKALEIANNYKVEEIAKRWVEIF